MIHDRESTFDTTRSIPGVCKAVKRCGCCSSPSPDVLALCQRSSTLTDVVYAYTALCSRMRCSGDAATYLCLLILGISHGIACLTIHVGAQLSVCLWSVVRVIAQEQVPVAQCKPWQGVRSGMQCSPCQARLCAMGTPSCHILILICAAHIVSSLRLFTGQTAGSINQLSMMALASAVNHESFAP